MATMNLREKAMLVKFKDSVWGGFTHDRGTTEKVHKDYEAKHQAGVYRKQLMPKAAFEVRQAIGRAARAYHNQMTLPWMDDGVRILPSSLYSEYMATMRKHQAAAEAADKDFYKNFPQYMEEAKKILGKMFHAEDYPAVTELQDKFSFSIVALPMPEVADWRVDIPAKELEALRKAASGALDELQKAAVLDLWARVQDVVEHVVERLKKSDTKFKNSLIGNVKEIVELLPKLNITADPKLTAIQKELEQKLCKLNPDELREDDGMRNKAAKDAEEILRKMASYIGKPKK